jgi:Family of unknown function (DUF6364)
MMRRRKAMAKVTLSVDLDAVLVERVRRYSQQRGKDVSVTVSELIEQLPLSGAAAEGEPPPIPLAATAGENWEAELSPAVRSLLGAGTGPADEEDYNQHLMEKYGR